MSTTKNSFGKVANMLTQLGFTIVQEDTKRPWGGFYVIDEIQAQQLTFDFFRFKNCQVIFYL